MKSPLAICLFLTVTVAVCSHELEGRFCFVMKNKKINPTYCLYVGETSIELSNGPVNYYAEALRIACDKYVCSIADEHNRKLAVFKKISSQEFVVTESYDIQAKKGRIGHHYFNKLVEVGDAFKKAEE